MTRYGDLQIEQDPTFQQREWRVQRIGWWLLAGFVVAAALGLFGGGPLSRAQAGERGAPLWIEYERFTKVGAPTRLLVHAQAAPHDGSWGLDLRVARPYFDAMEITRMVPQPASVEVGAELVRLWFAAPSARAEPLTVILDVQPRTIGWHRAVWAGAQGARVSFVQLAYF